MSSFRRAMGMDFVDFAIHAFVTVCAAVVLAGAAREHEEVMVAGAMAASALVLAWRRQRGLRRVEPDESGAGEVAAQRVAELEGRVAELEERLDFAERLLARHRDPARLGVGEER